MILQGKTYLHALVGCVYMKNIRKHTSFGNFKEIALRFLRKYFLYYYSKKYIIFGPKWFSFIRPRSKIISHLHENTFGISIRIQKCFYLDKNILKRLKRYYKIILYLFFFSQKGSLKQILYHYRSQITPLK